MSLLHRISLADCRPQPWRNGGGTTRELLAWPRADDWRLRLSVAEIAADGAFSSFAGVRRWFAVLDGAGVRLALPSGVVTRQPLDEPLAFDGEAAPMCTLLGGPTHDLNFMARRGCGHAVMRTARAGSQVTGRLPFRALYAAAPALLAVADHRETIAAGTLVWCDAPDAASWTLRDGAHAFWLTLEAA